MRQWERASYCLKRKKQILEKIAANTETQGRFIQKREMRGLKRMLRERAELIEELVAINAELEKDQSWNNIPGLAAISQATVEKIQDILERTRQVMQQAVMEKAQIANELRSSKVQRQIKNQYVNPWPGVVQGYRINERG